MEILFLLGALLRAGTWILSIRGSIDIYGRIFHRLNIVGSILIIIPGVLLFQWEISAVHLGLAMIAVLGLVKVEMIISERILNFKTFIILIFSSFIILYVLENGILSSMGYTGAVVLFLSYLLVANKSINTTQFLNMGIVVSVLTLPVLINDQNWSIVALIGLRAVFVFKKIYIQLKRFLPI